MLSENGARLLARGTTAGVVGLALSGFAMSYDALHALAAAQGVPAALAWLWPLVVDGFIVVASLSVVCAVAEGRRAIYPWTLVLTFSAISVSFNVVHAAPTIVARLVAAIPPAALVLSFEILMRHVREALRITPSTPPIRIHRQDTEPSSPMPSGEALALPTGPTEGGSSSLLDRAREIDAAYEASGQRATGTVLARELAISDGYGRRLLRQLAEERTREAVTVES